MQRPCGRKAFGESEGQDAIGRSVWELQATLETWRNVEWLCPVPLLCGSRRLLWFYRKRQAVDTVG